MASICAAVNKMIAIHIRNTGADVVSLEGSDEGLGETVVLIHYVDTDLKEIAGQRSTRGSRSPTGNPACFSMFNWLFWETSNLDITVIVTGNDIFREMDQTDIISFSFVIGVNDEVVSSEIKLAVFKDAAAQITESRLDRHRALATMSGGQDPVIVNYCSSASKTSQAVWILFDKKSGDERPCIFCCSYSSDDL